MNAGLLVFILLLALSFLGIPIYIALGIGTLVALNMADLPMLVLPQKLFDVRCVLLDLRCHIRAALAQQIHRPPCNLIQLRETGNVFCQQFFLFAAIEKGQCL